MVFCVRVNGFANPGGRTAGAGGSASEPIALHIVTAMKTDDRVATPVHIVPTGPQDWQYFVDQPPRKDWTAVSGRPTLNDFVRLQRNLKGLRRGDICQVTHDDRDNSPYKLKKVGTSSVKEWFTAKDVQKVEKKHAGADGPAARVAKLNLTPLKSCGGDSNAAPAAAATAAASGDAGGGDETAECSVCKERKLVTDAFWSKNQISKNIKKGAAPPKCKTCVAWSAGAVSAGDAAAKMNTARKKKKKQ